MSSEAPWPERGGVDGPASFAVRTMVAEDLGGVVLLAAEEATAPHWPVFEYQRMLDVIAEAPGRRGAWVLVRDCALGRGSGSGEGAGGLGAARAICGFAMASHVAGTCDLEAVVVEAAWRGRRLGARLVEAVVGWGRGVGAGRLELEVRASNEPALRLYRRMGFAIDGTRPGYYRNPEEEAVLMGLALGASVETTADASLRSG